MTLINSVVTPSRVTKSSSKWSTIKKTWPSGRTTAKRSWGSPQAFFELEWDGITLTEYNLLKAHFAANSGCYGVFTLTDTHDSVTYNVRYTSDELSRDNVNPNVRGLYKIKIQFEEDK